MRYIQKNVSELVKDRRKVRYMDCQGKVVWTNKNKRKVYENFGWKLSERYAENITLYHKEVQKGNRMEQRRQWKMVIEFWEKGAFKDVLIVYTEVPEFSTHFFVVNWCETHNYYFMMKVCTLYILVIVFKTVVPIIKVCWGWSERMKFEKWFELFYFALEQENNPK